MKTYKVTYKETLIHTFYVEANDKEEAERVFEEGCANSQFDFSDGEIDTTDYWADECDDETHWHYTSEDEDEGFEWDEPLADYIPSAENGDYSPSTPWNAPGMKISDFI